MATNHRMRISLSFLVFMMIALAPFSFINSNARCLAASTAGTKLSQADKVSFTDVAKKCHDYISENNFYYSKGVELPLDRSNNRRVDCSSYVSWCIYEYTNGAFDTSKDSKWFYKTAKSIVNGNECPMSNVTSTWEATKDTSNLKAGDILCYSDHVEIYAGYSSGTHYIYNAGSDKSIKAYRTKLDSSKFSRISYVIRIND